jgi:hypothetical protein
MKRAIEVMTQDEAQKKILRAYEMEYLPLIGGLQNRDPKMGPLSFYFWLQEEYPELLEFPDSGDRYQTITCWVRAANRGEID